MDCGSELSARADWDPRKAKARTRTAMGWERMTGLQDSGDTVMLLPPPSDLQLQEEPQPDLEREELAVREAVPRNGVEPEAAAEEGLPPDGTREPGAQVEAEAGLVVIGESHDLIVHMVHADPSAQPRHQAAVRGERVIGVEGDGCDRDRFVVEDVAVELMVRYPQGKDHRPADAVPDRPAKAETGVECVAEVARRRRNAQMHRGERASLEAAGPVVLAGTIALRVRGAGGREETGGQKDERKNASHEFPPFVVDEIMSISRAEVYHGALTLRRNAWSTGR